METNEYSMFHSICGDTKPYIVSKQVNETYLVMEVDSEAALSVISEQTYYKTLLNYSHPFQS